MPDCSFIDPLVTPYVDGELAAGDRQAVDEHLRACPPCRARVVIERAVRGLMRARRAALRCDQAPAALRATCASLKGSTGSHGSEGSAWWDRAVATFRTFRTSRTRTVVSSLALAATLVLVVVAAFLYQLTGRSTRVMAAELTADHVKCFLLHRSGATADSKGSVERSLAAAFEWNARLPEQADRAGLQLVGERTCLYAQGRVAHIMYEHDGHPVSVFMLPNAVREDDLVETLGHRAAVWSVGGRTFVLVASEPKADLERMASFIRAGLQ